MPPRNRTNSRNSQDTIANLLSEARHLVTRERTPEGSNRLQLQHVIETAQRELRRLRWLQPRRQRIENTFGNIRRNFVGRGRDTTRSADVGESSPDDGTGGVIPTMARLRQIIIIHPADSPESGVAARNENVERDGPQTEFDLNLEDSTDWMLAGLNEVLQQLNEHEVPSSQGHSTRREERESAADDDVRINSPGRPLLYTDLSRLPREQSFINFTDRSVRRRTSSTVPTAGNILNLITRDRDSWVIGPGPDPQRQRLATEPDGECSEKSEEEIDALTQFPSPPQSPPIRSHERASLNSTGATVGSETVLGETTKEVVKEEEMSFSKDRRAKLMAEMNADIARYAQEREWAFYREQGYGVLPRIHYPEMFQATTPVNNRGRGDVNEQRDWRSLPGFTGAIRTVAASAEPGRHHDSDTRATALAESSQQRQTTSIADQAEEFLAYVLQQPDLIRVADQLHYFEERYLQLGGGSLVRYRYSLVREPEDSEIARVEYDRLMTMLVETADRDGDYDTWAGGRPTGRGQTPLFRLMKLAEQDGMDIREAVRLIDLGRQWWNSGRIIEREDSHEFLPLPVMQFWIALRRGWGRWTPSKYMLDEARNLLLQYTLFNSVEHPSSTRPADEAALNMARPGMAGYESEEEKRMLCEVLASQNMSELRCSRLIRNWSTFRRFDFWNAPTSPRGRESVSDYRLDNLRRLIFEEAVINGRRGTLSSDGLWTEEESGELP